MSHMRDHIRAMRALGRALKDEGENGASIPANVEVLHLMGDAHLAAADQLEAEERAAFAELADARRCTLDHARLTVPKCPACGAPGGRAA